jgi:LmbE family N-acetylglucosaminyl deacetylase
VEQLQPIPEDWQRALAIVAHPDDLEYGASAAVAKWTTGGKQVAYLLATRGEAGIGAWPPERTAAAREAEERESARLVGVETVEFLNHQDGTLESTLALRRDLARAIPATARRPSSLPVLSWPGQTARSIKPTTAPSGWPRVTVPVTPAIAGFSRSCFPKGSSRGTVFAGFSCKASIPPPMPAMSARRSSRGSHH